MKVVSLYVDQKPEGSRVKTVPENSAFLFILPLLRHSVAVVMKSLWMPFFRLVSMAITRTMRKSGAVSAV